MDETLYPSTPPISKVAASSEGIGTSPVEAEPVVSSRLQSRLFREYRLYKALFKVAISRARTEHRVISAQIYALEFAKFIQLDATPQTYSAE